jgi:hypothetical protein
MKVILVNQGNLLIKSEQGFVEVPRPKVIPAEAIFTMKDDIVFDDQGNEIDYEGVYDVVILDQNNTRKGLIIFIFVLGLMFGIIAIITAVMMMWQDISGSYNYVFPAILVISLVGFIGLIYYSGKLFLNGYD